MHITLVISTLANGGAERVMTVMANYWAERGQEVTLITFSSAKEDFCLLHPGIHRVGLDLMGGTTVVSQSMAAMLGPGSVSALAYGSKVMNLLLGIGAVAVSTAVLPHFSHLVATTDWRSLRHTLVTYSRFLLIASLPVTAVLVYFSEPLVAALFQRGAFTEADTHLVGQVQAMYLLQVPLYVVGMLFVRLISALKANHLMMWGNVINLAICIVLTYFLMQRFGVTGVALATSLMYIFSVGFLLLVSMRLMREKDVVKTLNQ